ncbi:RNA polymerase subunit sigma [Pseudomonas frederiksbergensis]|uniref:RNA polymerase subunit sigma n=1 Tax=Pseudomonas frederiksbergensis TaxID=104087 RepID=A0A1J0EPI7_9PSED|nr:sigma-70 family RNA polymerase sigma factor [Pseudomonas frederiksbergensis]APC17942.1 RNA polymerase subunit sigma [Pseudomonas frederiksbergensis]
MSGTDLSHSEYVGGLFRSHYQWLCLRLRRHLDSSASAEDIAAQTFEQLLCSPQLLPIRQPRALLGTIAKRLIYRSWRRRDLEHEHLDQLLHEQPCPRSSPEDVIQVQQVLNGLERSFARLPGKVKATFLLSRFEGLTYPKIARELGISQRSVSVYMARSQALCSLWSDQSCLHSSSRKSSFQRSA